MEQVSLPWKIESKTTTDIEGPDDCIGVSRIGEIVWVEGMRVSVGANDQLRQELVR